MTIPIPADLGTPEPEEIVQEDHVVVWVYQNNKTFRLRTYGPYSKKDAQRAQRVLDGDARKSRVDKNVVTYVRKLLDFE